MAVAAVAVAGNILISSATTTAAYVGATVAVTAAGVLAAYVDQKYVYPALFGKKDPRPDSLEGFQLSTTDPGAARWQVFGTRAWVPCHYLWNENIRQTSEGGGGDGKGGGGRPRYNVLRADVGIGVADGPVADIDTMYAGENVFWARSFNRVTIEDSRWVIGPQPNPAWLGIVCSSYDAVDFAAYFSVDDLVRLENIVPASLNGYYRINFVRKHGVGGQPGGISLVPLQGQTPAVGVSGTASVPGTIRRMDEAFANKDNIPGAYANSQFQVDSQGLRLQFNETGAYDVSRFTEGQLYDVEQLGIGIEGRGVWRLKFVREAVAIGPVSSPPVGPFFRFDPVAVEPITSTNAQFIAAISGTNPVILVRSSQENFASPEEGQEAQLRYGTDTQVAPSSLTASKPEASGMRGIAYMGIANWNLGPHGNIFPQLRALVRASLGETIGQGLKRICSRTIPESNSDTSLLRLRPLHGYSIPGGLSSSQALQPLLIFYGLHVQDRGGVLTFIDERDLPIIPVPTRHLNALPDGSERVMRGFRANKREDVDIPQRVLLHYVGMTEGSNLSEGVGTRAPGSEDRGNRDTLDIQLRPLAAPSFEIKQRAREIHKRVKLEAYTGEVTLGPGYMDIQPSSCLTFASHDDNFENIAPGTTISHTAEVRDIVPGSLTIEVTFADGQTARLADDGDGALVGFPDSITTITTSTVDYATGEIDLDTTPALDDSVAPVVTYRYDRQWLMRVSQCTISGYDFSTACEVVQTSTDEILPPVTRDVQRGSGSPVQGGSTVDYITAVMDLPSIEIGALGARISAVAQKRVGTIWAGATVYRSPNGIDRWTPVATIGQPSLIGTAPGALPSGVAPGYVDWENVFVVDFPEADPAITSQTISGLSEGLNWAYIGGEVIAFHEVLLTGSSTVVFYGLVRGLRGTELAIDGHVDGEQVVLLDGFFTGAAGTSYEPSGGYAATNQSVYHRIVPGNRSVDSVATTTTYFRGRSAIPMSPVLRSDMVTVIPGNGIQVTWGRRSQHMGNLFGPAPLSPGEVEQYEVHVYDVAQATALGGTEADIAAATKRIIDVGGEGMGTPMARRSTKYSNSLATTDGFSIDSGSIGFFVKQVNAYGASDRSAIVTATPLS